MKNKYISFVALAAAALATSCASDDLAEQKQEQNEPRTVTLTASVNEVQTRVGMTKNDNKASFYWHKDDAISVQTVKDGSYSSEKFTITGEDVKDGVASVTFTADVTGTVGGYAVYPYNESHSFTDEKAMTYNLPASYTSYTPESKIFGTTGDYRSNSTNMPMLGTISGSDGNKSIKFKCLGGLAVIRIDQMPAAEGTLAVSADQQLSGNFTVSDLSASDAQIVNTSTAGNNSKTVTIAFSGATKDGVGVFYLPLATGSYTNVQIVLNSGKVNQTVDYGSLTVERAKVYAIPVVANRVINDHVFVDLGLSVLWAETNIGAETKTGYGNYYAWGETQTKDSYPQNDDAEVGSETLGADRDAAAKNWGSSCRMPTKEEFEELLNSDNCTWTWIQSGVKGYKVTSKKQGYIGNSIFLPASGYRFDDGFSSGKVTDQNSQGYYWSSTPNENSYAYCLNIWSQKPEINDSSFWYRGCTVRAVAGK